MLRIPPPSIEFDLSETVEAVDDEVAEDIAALADDIDDEPTVEEEPAPAIEEEPAAEAEEVPAAEGEEAPAADGEEAPAVDGEEAPATEGEEAPAADGEEAPETEGEEAPAEPTEADVLPEAVDEVVAESDFADLDLEELVEADDAQYEIDDSINPDDFDPDFLQWLENHYAENGQVLTAELVADESFLSISDLTSASLKGIEKFTSLTHINLVESAIETVDLTSVEKLRGIYINLSSFTTLNASGLTNLEYVHIPQTYSGNTFGTLNLSDCPVLSDVDIHSCTIGKLDVSNCTSLTELNIDPSSHDMRVSTLDVTGCSNLEVLRLDETATTVIPEDYVVDNFYVGALEYYGTGTVSVAVNGEPLAAGKKSFRANPGDVISVTATPSEGYALLSEGMRVWHTYPEGEYGNVETRFEEGESNIYDTTVTWEYTVVDGVVSEELYVPFQYLGHTIIMKMDDEVLATYTFADNPEQFTIEYGSLYFVIPAVKPAGDVPEGMVFGWKEEYDSSDSYNLREGSTMWLGRDEIVLLGGYVNGKHISIAPTANGTVTCEKNLAAEQELLHFTATPAEGYTVSAFSFTNNGSTVYVSGPEAKVEVLEKGALDISFYVPSSDVTISVEFESLGSSYLYIADEDFPDETFREFVHFLDQGRRLNSSYGYTWDNALSESEVRGYGLNLSRSVYDTSTQTSTASLLSLDNVKGIEKIPALTSLWITYATIGTMDLTGMADLKNLNFQRYVSDGQAGEFKEYPITINTLILTGCTGLASNGNLNLSNLGLSNLDISGLALNSLNVSNNNLSVLDISTNTKLRRIYRKGNRTEEDGVVYYSLEGESLIVDAGTVIDATFEGPYDPTVLSAADFEDADLYAYLIDEYDDDDNGEFSQAEVDNVTRIMYGSTDDGVKHGASSAKGIEAFTNLEELYLTNGTLTEIDLSNFSKLRVLQVYDNALTALDISHNPELNNLECQYNKLTTLDIGANSTLVTAVTAGEVDDSSSYMVTFWFNDDNQTGYVAIDSRVTLTANGEILRESEGVDPDDFDPDFYAWLDNYYGASLTERNLAEVTWLNINDLTASSLKGIEKFTSLQTLDLDRCDIETVDLTSVENLGGLSMDTCNIGTVDVSGLTSLTNISTEYWTGKSTIGTLNASGCTRLYGPSFWNTAIGTLDVSNCTNIVELKVETEDTDRHNSFGTVNVTGCTNLDILHYTEGATTLIPADFVSKNFVIDEYDHYNGTVSITVNGETLPEDRRGFMAYPGDVITITATPREGYAVLSEGLKIWHTYPDDFTGRKQNTHYFEEDQSNIHTETVTWEYTVVDDVISEELGINFQRLGPYTITMKYGEDTLATYTYADNPEQFVADSGNLYFSIPDLKPEGDAPEGKVMGWSSENDPGFTITKGAGMWLGENREFVLVGRWIDGKTIRIAETANGTVTCEDTVVGQQSLVRFIVTPDEGYRISSVSIDRADGQEQIPGGPDATLELLDNGALDVGFYMPASDVTLSAEFESLGSNYIRVTEEDFPDETFRKSLMGRTAYVNVKNYGSVQDGILGENTLHGSLNISYSTWDPTTQKSSYVLQTLDNVKGIEKIPGLTYFSIMYTNIDTVDLTGMTGLEQFSVIRNMYDPSTQQNNVYPSKINTLILNGCTGLGRYGMLDLSDFGLTKLEVRDTNISRLNASKNNLSTLDIRGSETLVKIYQQGERSENNGIVTYSWQGCFLVVDATTTVNDGSKNLPQLNAPEIVEGLAYDGESHELLTAGEVIEGGTLQYSADGETWGDEIPTAKDAGEHSAYYKVIGDEEHEDIDPVELKVTIEPKELTLNWTIPDEGFVYEKGVEQLPELTVSGMIGDDECTAEVALDSDDAEAKAIDAGNYTAKAVNPSNANYKLPEDATFDFTIAKAVLEDVELEEALPLEAVEDGKIDLSEYLEDYEGLGMSKTGLRITSADLDENDQLVYSVVAARDNYETGEVVLSVSYFNYEDRDITVRFTFAFSKYNLIFDTDGGTPVATRALYGGSDDDGNATGQAYGELPETTKAGHTLDGWFDEDGNEVTAETRMYPVDTTVHAKWTAPDQIITLNLNNENAALPEDYAPEGVEIDPETLKLTFNVDTPAFELPVLADIEGYTFIGWATEASIAAAEEESESVKAEIKVSLNPAEGVEEVTYVAQWSEIEIVGVTQVEPGEQLTGVVGSDETASDLNNALKEIASDLSEDESEEDTTKFVVSLQVSAVSTEDAKEDDVYTDMVKVILGDGAEEEEITDTLEKDMEFMDISVGMVALDESNAETPVEELELTKLSDIPRVLEIPLQFNLSDRYDPVVYRIHNGEVMGLSRLDSRPAAGAAEDGTYYVDGSGDNTVIYVYSSLFSTYAVRSTTTKTFNVLFNANGGTMSTKSLKAIAQEGEDDVYLDMSEVDEPTRASAGKLSYSFDGWYNGDEPFDPEAPLTADITLTAKWITKASVAMKVSAINYDDYDGTSDTLEIGYDGKEHGIEVTNDDNADITVYYSLSELDETNYTFTTPDLKTFTDVGTEETIWWYAVSSDPSMVPEPQSGSVKLTITKGTPVITKAPAALTLTENGKAQTLISAGTAEYTNGEAAAMLYKLDNGTYKADLPTATKAGTYTVYYMVEGNDNYDELKDEAQYKLTVTIKSKATPAAATSAPAPAAPAAVAPAPAPVVEPIPTIYAPKKSNKATINVGTVYQIDLAGGIAKSYKSSKKKVATVTKDGLVIPKKKGKVKITVKVGKKKRVITLTVKDPTIPTKVFLNMAGTVPAQVGVPQVLTVTLPEGTNSGIKWTSSNKKIATVSNGVVTFKKAGKVTITATATRGKKKAKVKFKVTK